MVAYENNHNEIVEFLISKRADITGLKDLILENILISNIKNKKIDNCLIMLNCYKNKINYKYKDKENNNFLHYIAITNSIKLLEEFLKRGCEINCKNIKEETPLYKALCSEYINESFILYLIKNGAILNPKSYINEKALIDMISSYKAICNKLIYTPLINKLLGNKINLNESLRNKIKEIIKTLKLKEIDFNNEVQMTEFIKNSLIDLPSKINLEQIIIKEDDNQDIELNIALDKYKERIMEYIRDKIEENKVLWNKVRDYIEREIFKGRPVLEIEDFIFIYNEDYKMKIEAVKALLICLKLY